MRVIRIAIEAVIFSSRWLVAPFLLGLVVGLLVLLYQFVNKLVDFMLHFRGVTHTDVIIGILHLVDLSLTANLILIVICSSYDNFVSQIDPESHPTWPKGLTHIGFAGLKQRLLGSIVSITAVSVLEWFMDIDQHADAVKLTWVVGILMALAVAMLILALADRLASTGAES